MEKNKPKIHTLAVGMPKELIDSKGRSMITGIEKQSVQEVYLSSHGFEGDDVADKNIMVALTAQFVYILRSITSNGNRNLGKRCLLLHLVKI